MSPWPPPRRGSLAVRSQPFAGHSMSANRKEFVDDTDSCDRPSQPVRRVRCLRRRRRRRSPRWPLPSSCRRRPPHRIRARPAQVAKTVGSVATSTGHLPGLASADQPGADDHLPAAGGPQSLVALKTYFDANPQVAKDLQTLQQPLTDLSGECKLPVTVPQILGLLQGAQQGGGLPAGLPGSLPGAQSVGMPGAALPAQSSPASAVVRWHGPAARSGDHLHSVAGLRHVCAWSRR